MVFCHLSFMYRMCSQRESVHFSPAFCTKLWWKPLLIRHDYNNDACCFHLLFFSCSSSLRRETHRTSVCAKNMMLMLLLLSVLLVTSSEACYCYNTSLLYQLNQIPGVYYVLMCFVLFGHNCDFLTSEKDNFRLRLRKYSTDNKWASDVSSTSIWHQNPIFNTQLMSRAHCSIRDIIFIQSLKDAVRSRDL